MSKTYGSAFPGEYGSETFQGRTHYPGLTKREFIAAKAMEGFISLYGIDGSFDSNEIAKRSVQCADSLLNELEAKKE